MLHFDPVYLAYTATLYENVENVEKYVDTDTTSHAKSRIHTNKDVLSFIYYMQS